MNSQNSNQRMYFSSMGKHILQSFLFVFYSCLAVSQTSPELASVTDLEEDIPLHLREVPRHNLMIDAGILESTGGYGDVARSGLNINLGYDYYINKNVALSSSLRHSYNEFGVDLPGQIDVSQDDTENYSLTALSLGPNFTLRHRRFQFDAFARGGIAFINSPNKTIVYLGDITGFASDEANTDDSAAYGELGLRCNYYFSKQVQWYFSPMYSQTFGKPLAYIFMSREESNIANLHFNIGIKIALGKVYSNGEKRLF